MKSDSLHSKYQRRQWSSNSPRDARRDRPTSIARQSLRYQPPIQARAGRAWPDRGRVRHADHCAKPETGVTSEGRFPGMKRPRPRTGRARPCRPAATRGLKPPLYEVRRVSVASPSTGCPCTAFLPRSGLPISRQPWDPGWTGLQPSCRTRRWSESWRPSGPGWAR